MVRICPHCGLPLTSTGSSEHSSRFPHQGEFVASLEGGCLFTTDEAGFPVALCAAGPQSPDDESQLTALHDDDFLIPGLPEDRDNDGDLTWIRFRSEGTLMPLPACRLRAHPPSGELIWSWFRQAFLALSRMHELGLLHEAVDENLFWMRSGGGAGAAVDNRMHLLVPRARRPLDSERLQTGRREDLKALGDLFERLLMETSWQRGLDEFREMCMALRDDPDAAIPVVEPEIRDCRRMAQLQSPEPVQILKKVAWKKPALIFGILFSLSMVATWLFSGEKKKPSELPPEPVLRKPPPHFEPVVERSSLKWDPVFPLHRVAMSDSVLVYVHPARIPEFEFLVETASLLGFSIPPAFRKTDRESVFSLQLSGDGWKSRLTFSMTKLVPSPSPPDTSQDEPATPPTWTVQAGAGRLLKPDAVSPPPLLLGELGALLTEAGYFPENISQERLVMIFAPPATLAPRHTVWQQLLGGIRPTYLVLRLSGANDVITCLLTYERPQDARGAASFLKDTLNSAGAPGGDLMEVRDRRLRLQVPLSLLRELAAAKVAPVTPPPPATRPPDVPSPPLVPIESETPPSEPVPMEFLNIPEP